MMASGGSADSCWRCSVCRGIFSEPWLLREHYRDDHPEQRPFACELCPDTFRSVQELLVHRQTHGRDVKKSPSVSSLKEPQSPGAVPKPYKCAECLREFGARNALQEHLRAHISGEVLGTAKHAEDLRHPCAVGQQGEKVFECSQCAKKFFLKSHLLRHSLSHTNERPFACSDCPKTFYRKDKLTVHLRVHSDERPHACDLCPQKFKESKHLSAHRISHTGARPFECEVCSKRFMHKKHLNVHNLSHSNAAAYACEHCSKTFRRKYHLDSHIRKCQGAT